MYLSDAKKEAVIRSNYEHNQTSEFRFMTGSYRPQCTTLTVLSERVTTMLERVKQIFMHIAFIFRNFQGISSIIFNFLIASNNTLFIQLLKTETTSTNNL